MFVDTPKHPKENHSKASNTGIRSNVGPSTSTCGVKVYTWGTDPGAGNGMVHYLDASFFGGNVGHAAIQVTFPKNEKGEQLKKLCDDLHLPCSERTVTTRDTQGNVIFNEVVYDAYWSWWGGQEKGDLTRDVSQDGEIQWIATPFAWDPQKQAELNPEQRRHKGHLGQQVITHGIKGVLHNTYASSDPAIAEHMEFIKAEARTKDILEKIEALELLTDKLDRKWQAAVKAYESHNKNKKGEWKKLGTPIIKIQNGQTEALILDRLLPDWRESISNEIDKKIDKTTKQKMKVISLNEEKYKIIAEKIEALKLQNLEKVDNEEKAATSLADQQQDSKIAKLRVQYDQLKDETKKKEIMAQIESETKKKGSNPLFSARSSDSLLDKYQTKGLPPSHVVRLPIHPVGGSKVGLKRGLDVEKMILKMGELKNKKFSLLNNCSETAGLILEAGAVKNYQKGYFKRRAFGFVGNPQEVLNGATKFQSVMMRGEPHGMQKLLDYHPIERAAGALARNIRWAFDGDIRDNALASLPPNTSKMKRGWTWTKTFAKQVAVGFLSIVGQLLLAPIAITAFIIPKVLNPLQTYKDSTRLTKFAFNRGHIGLSALASVTLVPIAIITAPLAALQYGIKRALFDPIRSWFESRKNVSKESKKEAEIKDDFKKEIKEDIKKIKKPINKKEIEQLEKLGKQVGLKKLDSQEVKRKYSIEKIRTLDAAHPLDTISEAMQKHKDSIPLLSDKAARQLRFYLKEHPEEKAHYDDVMHELKNRLQPPSRLKP